MAKKTNKFNSLETQLASSILYYDKEEIGNFIEVYDSLLSEDSIVVDGIFDMFVSILKTIRPDTTNGSLILSEDSETRRQQLIDFIKINIDHLPNSNERDIFELWFDAVINTDTPMELSEDILYHFLWEEYKRNVEDIDKSNIPFKEKLTVRPKTPKALSEEGLVFLGDIDFEEESSNKQIFPSGLEELDHVVRFEETNFCVIAARPGVGKSLFMVNMAIANAKAGIKTLFMSFEMGKDQVTDRILNNYAGENLQHNHTDEFNIVDTKGLNKAKKSIVKSAGFANIKDNLQLLVEKATSADSILLKIEEKVLEGGYKAIFIDYLQLLRYNRLDEWSSLRELTKALKNLAFRLDILVVTGSQVSRSSTEKGLYLSDLFGSSSIESDTDVVIGLEAVRERKQGEKALVNVKVMKNRKGDVAELKHIVDYSSGRMVYNE